MKLNRLEVHNLRNIHSLDLPSLGAVNLFYGVNGAGKTTLLEAIHLLAMGRSFRSAQSRRVIRYEAESCAVIGQASEGEVSHRLGIQRKRSGGFAIRINGESAKSASSLARILPVQLLNSESFALLEQGPKKRRQLLDWGVFHVEHRFHEAWARVQRALKQRNSLLKKSLSIQELKRQIQPWDRELAQAGFQMYQMRDYYFDMFHPVLESMVAELVGVKEKIDISLVSGWRISSEAISGFPNEGGKDKEVVGEQAFLDALKAQLPRESQRKMTLHGPHRADLSITVNGIDAGQVLSRGQQKMLVCALKLAQLAVFETTTGRSSILLADDLPAELDDRHQSRLFSALDRLDCQCFLTSVGDESLEDDGWQNKGPIKRFHVKQGSID